MPTEVTTETRHVMSRAAENSRVQQRNEVIEVNRTVVRQGLSENDQSVPPARESTQPSNQQLELAADNMNSYVQSFKRDLHFSLNEDTGETIIKVFDSESQKLIRTIPSDEFLAMSQHFNQSVGMLLNAKA